MNEVEIHCPVSRQCGGCALIDLPYASQLEHKQALVRAALDAHVSLRALPLSDCMPATRRAGYRNRAKLAVAGEPSSVRIGLFRRGSHELIDLALCQVQQPTLMRGLELLRGWIAEERLAVPMGPLFYVDLRQTVGQGCHLTLVADRTRELPSDWPLDSLLERWPELCGVALNLGNPASSFALAAESTLLHGEPIFSMSVGEAPGLEFEVPAGGFFQVSVEALPALHQQIATQFAGCSEILDLYCGVGVHGIAVALCMETAPALQGVDSSPLLVEAARRNASRHRVSASFDAGTVEERVGDALGQGAAVMLNPGRSGCRPPVLDWFGSCRAPRVAYLSCHPRSLARDLVALVGWGYEVERLQPIDLMPQTDQVETLALLRYSG